MMHRQIMETSKGYVVDHINHVTNATRPIFAEELF